jgi:heparosan-N-sulfate-glucuronate 5-epimerase
MGYVQTLWHCTSMAFGWRYWHQPQGLGKLFRPGELHGYFNDLTAKAAWPGETCGQGNPICEVAGVKGYWPSTVLQKGLAHWDLWLESGRGSREHWKGFQAAAQWACDSQDAIGGWRHPVPLHPRAVSEYSCMSQGQGVSILARAYCETSADRYLAAARRAVKAILLPKSSGGTAVPDGDSLIFEEYPADTLNPVLNGWIFAVFGLYDFGLVAADEEASRALSRTVQTLCDWLPRFDCGFWSMYDNGETIASTFYHRLHIAQLDALRLAFPERERTFSLQRDRFSKQLSSGLNLRRALAIRIAQKLGRPDLTPSQSSLPR